MVTAPPRPVDDTRPNKTAPLTICQAGAPTWRGRDQEPSPIDCEAEVVSPGISALGQKRSLALVSPMSALRQKRTFVMTLEKQLTALAGLKDRYFAPKLPIQAFPPPDACQTPAVS